MDKLETVDCPFCFNEQDDVEGTIICTVCGNMFMNDEEKKSQRVI